MRQPPKDQTSLAPSKALATVRGLAKSDPAETNSVSDAMDMDPSSPTTNGAKDSGQGTEPSDLSTNEGSVLDKANAGNTVYTMDEKTKHEADILFKAVMEGYNSAEKQPNPSMKHSTPSASKPEEGDVASRGTEPAAIAAPLPISAGGKGDTGARGSKSPIAKPKSVQATARPLTNSSPALVIGELGAEIRPAKGTEPVAATKSQPTTLKGSEGDSIIIENKSPVAKPKPKGIATPLTPATDSHAMGRLHDTSDQASDRTSDQCSNRLEPKPVWPVPPPPPHSVFPPATKTLPTPRPPAYRKPDSSPGPKSAESAKATINDNPQAPEEAVSTATPNSNGGSFSKKLVPKPTGPLVASSDALAAARKLAVQEKGLKSKAKNVPRNVLPTPMLPPRYQDTRAQSPQSQSLETNSARPSPQPLTPITSAQISVHKPASYAKPSPSSDTKTTGTTGIAKSSVHREGVLFPHTVPGLSNTPSPTSSVPTPPPMSMATTPSKNVDDSRSIPEKTKDATANPIASRPFYKAPKSAIEEPSPQFTPLVSKSNFLYFEPSAVKKSPGDPHEKQPATPNLAPLSDLPSTSSPGTKPKPGRMVFTVTRYKDDNNATTTITPFHSAKFYGHEILSAGESNRFSWEKLCEILESRHKFVDFKECLVINRFHVVEGEKDLNEGLNLGIYLNVNEVLIVKVDLLGRLPPPLVAEMKAARLAARKAGKEVE
ncbi:hypothetical protein L873DRAFT_707234 [Choiromyces venosus 120613-1]|uniref:Uncharacterized protein n=1 Tax=Choiromyces venosus 120613-1 TaxID=1336337 RepID=A0A3N4ITC9_9PEZI|nr:hypothetical protein L873DRAFT_707234 [Choiromyces venosus 120613-1]